jgi:hypothetical protein
LLVHITIEAYRFLDIFYVILKIYFALCFKNL